MTGKGWALTDNKDSVQDWLVKREIKLNVRPAKCHTDLIWSSRPVGMELVMWCQGSSWCNDPQRDSADAEIKIPSAEIPVLSKPFSFKPGESQNIALHASPVASNLSPF